MNWWKLAKNGAEQTIKDRIRSSPFFIALFKKHNVDIDNLDDLSIITDKLDKAHCMTGDDKIIVDDPLVKSKDIFNDKFHYIAHEVLHWLKGKNIGNTDHSNNEHYFEDSEELESFTTAIAYYIHKIGKDKDVYKKLKQEFLPLIRINIKDKTDASAFFEERYEEAKMMLKELSLCNFL